MAGKSEVEYTVGLRDQMSKKLKLMGFNVKSLRNALVNKLGRGLGIATKSIKVFGIALGIARAAAVGLSFVAIRMGKQFVAVAQDAQQTGAKFRAVFKEMSGEAEVMASSIADGLGQSQLQVKSFMARLQDTFVPMGLARDKAMDWSVALTSLAFDLAASNREVGTASDVMDKLSAAMTGSHESVAAFGILINKTTLDNKLLEMQVSKVNGAYTEQDKAMARLLIIMESTKDVQGFLIKNSGLWAIQVDSLKAALGALRVEIGERLIAELQDVVREMGGVAGIVTIARSYFEFFAQVLIQTVIPAFKSAGMGLAAFITALGGTNEAVLATTESVSLLSKVFAVSWKTIAWVFLQLIAGIRTIIWVVTGLWNTLKVLVSLVGLGLTAALRAAIHLVSLLGQGLHHLALFIQNTLIKVFQSLLNTLADTVEGIGDTLAWLGTFAVVPDIIATAGKKAHEAAAGLRDFSDAGKDLIATDTPFKRMSDELAKLDKVLQSTQADVRKFISESLDEINTGAMDWANAIVPIAETIEELNEEIQKGTAEIGVDYDALAEKVRAAMAALAEAEIITPEQQSAFSLMNEHLERMYAFFRKNADEADALAKAGYSLSDAMADMKLGAAAFAEEIPTMSEAMQDLTKGALTSFGNGMTDALMSIIDGSASAGEAFKKFASSFLMDLSKMIIQTLVFQALKSIFTPLADGGIVSGGIGDLTAFANGGAIEGGLGRFMPVKGYATGGPIVNKPHVALIGEGKHNEAVVPLPDGRSIPVDMQGSAETAVSININAVDGASVDRMLFDRRDTLKALIASAISESRSFRGAVARA